MMNIEEKLLDLQKLIGIQFSNADNLKSAVSHSSYINEIKINKWQDYERLEFLGDAVLEIVSSEYIFKKYPQII